MPVRLHWRRLRALSLVLAIVAAVGCATHGASIEHRRLVQDSGSRYEIEQTRFFVMPLALTAPDPGFPADLDGAGSSTATVCMELWLSAEGSVDRVLPLYGQEGCAAGPRPVLQPYEAVVRQTLRNWEFTPAMICEFPPGAIDKLSRGDCTGAEVRIQHVPVRLAYAFTFNNHDGKRSVRAVKRRVQGAH